MVFAPWAICRAISCTNRRSVDASVCVVLHVIAECRDFKLDAAARPITKTVAVIVDHLPRGAIDETQTGFTMDFGDFVRFGRGHYRLCPGPLVRQERRAGGNRPEAASAVDSVQALIPAVLAGSPRWVRARNTRRGR